MKKLLILLFTIISLWVNAQTLPNYWVPTSGTDTYTTGIPNLGSAYTNKIANVKFGITNTGAATININSIGAVALKKWDGSAWVDLAAGDLKTTVVYKLDYDGTNFNVSGGNLGDGAGSGGIVDPGGASNGDYLGYAGGAPVWTTQNWIKTSGTSTLTGATVIDAGANELTIKGDVGITISNSAGTSGIVISSTGFLAAGNNFTLQLEDVDTDGGLVLSDSRTTPRGIVYSSINTFTPLNGSLITKNWSDNGVQTMINKTLTSPAINSPIINGTTFSFSGGSSTEFITGGVSGTYTLPPFTADTLVGTYGGQILSNKGLISPQIYTADKVFSTNLLAQSGVSPDITLPSTTGTLTTLAGSESLTNKSVNGVTLTASGGADNLLNEQGDYVSAGDLDIPTYADLRTSRTVSSADAIVQADQFKVVKLSSGTPFDLTIDQLLIGTQVTLRNIGSATVTFVDGTGVTSTGATTLAAGEDAVVIYTTATGPEIKSTADAQVYDIAEDDGIEYRFDGDAGSQYKNAIAMASVSGGSYSTEVVSTALIPNNSIVQITVHVNGVNSDGSEGYGGTAVATFRKTSGGTLSLIGSSGGSLVEDMTGTPTAVLSVSSGIQLGVTIPSGSFNQSAWGEYTLTTY